MFGDDYQDALDEAQYSKLYEKFEARKKGDPFKHEKLNEDENEPFGNPEKSHQENDPYGEKDAKNVDEMKKVGGLSGPDQNKGNENEGGGPKPERIEEEKDDHDEREEDEMVDEIHGQSYSAGKVRAGTLPNDGQQYRNRKGNERTRAEWGKMSESYNKKIKSLLEDKKKLSKKLNEYRESVKRANKIVEQYKNGVENYREHLQEMAIFNTNLAHVNNILVESFEDKTNVKKIIDRFKNIQNIDESKKTFKAVIAEMKNSKKGKQAITEEVEEKLNKKIIGESSGKSVEKDKTKIIEESAYKNNDHLKKLNRLINYKLGN
jgi:hypothetical protein